VKLVAKAGVATEATRAVTTIASFDMGPSLSDGRRGIDLRPPTPIPWGEDVHHPCQDQSPGIQVLCVRRER
jgi:hypothetical protein